MAQENDPMHAFARCSLHLAGWALLVTGCAAPEPSGFASAGFPSPAAAATALADAARAGSTDRLVALFGPQGHELISSGDAVDDGNRRTRFLELYDQGHRLESGPEATTLLIGPDEWPFPVPIVQRGGAWSFDAAAGLDEIINRRIGRNELDTIETCRAIIDAQREYAALSWDGKAQGEYARRLLSSTGGAAAATRDGLYWATAAGEPPSPLGPLVAQAQAQGYTASKTGEPQPYHGYIYGVLTEQGAHAPGGAASYLVDGRLTKGFGVLAYPVEYGNSGVMSFLVGANGIVFEADLGPDTAKLARAMTTYDPDERWLVCD